MPPEEILDAEVVAELPQLPTVWLQDFYTIRQKVLAIGGKYYIDDAAGRPLAFCHQKAFKFKEDVRIFESEAMATEFLSVQQLQWLDAFAQFRVTDSLSGQLLGYINRQWMTSNVQSEYLLLDGYERPFARIIEDSLGMGLARRLSGGILPSTYVIELQGRPVAKLTQDFKLIGDTWTLDARGDPDRVLDRRLMVAGALLMDIVEQHEKRSGMAGPGRSHHRHHRRHRH